MHKNVVPLVLNFDISEIADHEAFCFGLIEFTLQHIRCCCFIISGLMRLIMRYCVRGYKTLLFHDTTDSAPGKDESLFLKYEFDLACSIRFSTRLMVSLTTLPFLYTYCLVVTSLLSYTLNIVTRISQVPDKDLYFAFHLYHSCRATHL